MAKHNIKTLYKSVYDAKMTSMGLLVLNKLREKILS